MEVIRTRDLTKHFGNTIAADQISIHINKGEIYGFLGLNGAGKTTLIRMLLGMIKTDSGEIFLFDKKLNPQFNLWNQIGYLVETPFAYPNLSVYENLKVYFHLRMLDNIACIDDIINKLKLTQYKNIKAGVLSLGNQQRLGLAKALLHKPQLLILDEPINGLDPEGIKEIRDLLLAQAAEGATIFLSSHILNEISKVADRIGIIHQGKLIKELNTNELNAQRIRKLIVQSGDNIAVVELLKNKGFQAEINAFKNIEISDKNAVENPEIISQLIVENNIPLKEIRLYTEDLELFFLRTIRNQ